MNPTSTLTDRADTGAGVPADVGGAGVPLRALVRVMRPYQWVKTFLLALPLLLSAQWQLPGRLFNVALAFVAFSLCASFGYVLNDLRDAEDDRHHPVKLHRPFAARQLSRPTGYVLALAL